MEYIERSGYGCEILALVLAQQIEAKLIWIAVTRTSHCNHLLAALKTALAERECLLGIGNLRAHILSYLLQYEIVVRVLLTHNNRSTLLDYTTLLAGNLWQRVAEILGVLEAYVCNHRKNRLNDIRSIQTASQARFDNRNLDITLRKVVECHSRCHLEERELQSLHFRAVAIDKIDHLLLRNHLAIHTNTLTEVGQMRRSEQARLISRLLQNCSQHIRYRALAVGTCNVNHKVVALWIAYRTTELGDALQARFVGITSDMLKRRH